MWASLSKLTGLPRDTKVRGSPPPLFPSPAAGAPTVGRCAVRALNVTPRARHSTPAPSPRRPLLAPLCPLPTPPPNPPKVFCAHEYTASNARFAVSVNPGNAALVERKAAVDAARAKVGRGCRGP
jgi:hypothetical protein